MTEESASSFAVKAGWGLWSASGGASHTSASSKAMSSMTNLDVEVSMECIVVNIDRPWLHAELFPLSPGETELLKMVNGKNPVHADFQQFSSYPTAFVIAANVEIGFSGDTSSLQSTLESSSTEANVSVGWGPFAVSGSHKQSKTKSMTRMESTATGMKISLQAPQIIGWVQTLLPKLPRDPKGKSRMDGLSLA
ncbi:hypothetical protein MMC17_003036 [Xylographa soralifera]|nr:hypothetical protein [Xylographa soralifera]